MSSSLLGTESPHQGKKINGSSKIIELSRQMVTKRQMGDVSLQQSPHGKKQRVQTITSQLAICPFIYPSIFIHSFIHSFEKKSLRVYCVLETVWDTWNREVNKTKIVLEPKSVGIKQLNGSLQNSGRGFIIEITLKVVRTHWKEQIFWWIVFRVFTKERTFDYSLQDWVGVFKADAFSKGMYALSE